MVTSRGYTWGTNGSATPLFLIDRDFIHFHKQAGGLLFYHLDHFKNHLPSWCMVRTISWFFTLEYGSQPGLWEVIMGTTDLLHWPAQFYFCHPAWLWWRGLRITKTCLSSSCRGGRMPRARLIIVLLWLLNVQRARLGLKQCQLESFSKSSYMDAGGVSFSRAV